MLRFRHPVGIVTKGALVERDIDLLQELAQDGLATVAISITTLKSELKRTLEPRAASGAARLRTLRRLSDAGIPTMVLFSPVIPFVNDAEMETVLAAARDAGARRASYQPEERREGQEWVGTCRSRWWRYYKNKNKIKLASK